MGDIPAHFKFHSANDPCPDSCFCRLPIHRNFSFGAYFGAVFGFKVLRVGHVGSPIAQGLSMGTATHAVGTSTAMEISGKYGAYASLGLTLNGIMTAIFTPTILRLLGVI